MVRANLAFGETWVPWDWLSPYARIVHWHNTGAAFGMLQDFGLAFTLLEMVVAVAILYYYPQVPKDDWSLRVAMILQLGGAVGNLIDRLRAGEVTDFVSVGSFPVFNVADASISTGVAILLLGIWLKERSHRRAPEGAGEDPDDLANSKRVESAAAERGLRGSETSVPGLDALPDPVSDEIRRE